MTERVLISAALIASLKAKTGQLTERGRCDLLVACVQHGREDFGLSEACVAFVDQSRFDPMGAGQALSDKICDRLGCHGEQPSGNDWRDRRDCGV